MSGFDTSMPPSSGPLEIGATRARVAPASPVQAAWEALRCVYDPELCLDVVSLGLVYEIREERGNVVVEMTLTTPGCPVSESLPIEARGGVGPTVEPRHDGRRSGIGARFPAGHSLVMRSEECQC
jgi:Iron-sulfur cluster assembly protein